MGALEVVRFKLQGSTSATNMGALFVTVAQSLLEEIPGHSMGSQRPSAATHARESGSLSASTRSHLHTLDV